MKNVSSFLPEWVKKLLRPVRYFLFYYGTKRFCPVCRHRSRKFLEFGIVPRADAVCTYCGALERHRFEWLFLKNKTDLFKKQQIKILHVAPEKCFEDILRTHFGNNYITADLQRPNAAVKMDITDIKYPDGTFDVILCSHVLEHVQDDRRAMKEFYRVLKQDGWAVLLVPITADRTFEDPSIVDPLERLKAFGQDDHVRRYGPDFIDRLREASFKVSIITVSDLFEDTDIALMGLTPATGDIYYCTKSLYFS
jgi:SAM-dependent methyltransferase